jgi:hypothetical protein
MIGDVINLTAAPNTVVGVLTAPAIIGDTVLNVSPTAVTNPLITRGIYLTVDNNGGTTNNGGRVTAYDATLNTITIETPLTNNFGAGTSTILLNLKNFDNLIVHRPNSVHRIGEKGFQAKAILAGTIMRLEYTNNTGAAKKLYMTTEYYYI